MKRVHEQNQALYALPFISKKVNKWCKTDHEMLGKDDEDLTIIDHKIPFFDLLLKQK